MKRRKYSSRIEHGFTLVELLVVIAIIGILATMSIIQFTRVQVRAKAIQIVSDFSSIDKAMKMYAESQGRTTWWLDDQFDGPGVSDVTSFVRDTGLSQFLPKAPKYKNKDYQYSNQGDPFDVTGTGCGSYGDGVSLYLDLGDPTVRTEVDKIVDNGNGLTCGKITGGSTYVMYKLGNDSTDLKI